jgi:predicted metal-dependent phosphoesterase TrpH
VESYIHKLIEHGFDGMLITDHNSYKGYQKWKEISDKFITSRPFTVLKGIEYDTWDGGHIIAVLPDHVHCKLLELRGMSLHQLEKLVHSLGGILGPAHPYGTGFFAFMNNLIARRNHDIIHTFDFIETFNSCTIQKCNEMASRLAKKYEKTAFAGSDAHKLGVIGTAFTTITDTISTNNDLIRAVKDRTIIQVEEDLQQVILKKSNPFFKQLGIIGYWIYNKLGALFYLPARTMLKFLHNNSPKTD